MLNKPAQLRQAHDLYFQTDMPQSQIAELLNVNRKTLYLWMKEGNWQQVKRSARHTPSILAEQYYRQLAAMNDAIEARQDRPYPTREEAEVIRKLTLTIGRIKTGQTVSEHIETMTRFMEQLKKEAPALVQEILPYTDSFIKSAKEKSTREDVLEELLEDKKEMQEADTTATPPLPRCLFQNEIVLPELKAKKEEINSITPSNPEAGNTESKSEEPSLNSISIEQVSENSQPPMGSEWGINPRVSDPESLMAQYLEQKYNISHDPYVYRRNNITVIMPGSPLWGRNKPLWW